MAYKPNKYGLMIIDNPEQAFLELKALFKRDKSILVLSENLGVDRHTVAGWIKKLVDMGKGDPRVQDEPVTILSEVKPKRKRG